jgi:hypothetical protein
MRTSSAKAKGRRLQDWMKSNLILRLGLEKTTDLVRTAIMGESGADVSLVSTLHTNFPYSIECKNQEKYKRLYDDYAQATSHSHLEPIVVIKMNNKKPLILVDAEHFLDLTVKPYVKR